ncbi:MAG: hypothetical protein RIC18_07625 [Hoeflea sp.]|uniref:hypothetical protein n=1 Tax=Hoeflea sp. TaxID=1940281 RepID=UPI0032EB5097
MSTAFPFSSIISSYANAKARQYKRDAAFAGFIGLMLILASLALTLAFAAYVAQTYGIVTGLLAAAGLTVLLALAALAVRSLLRARERRHQRVLKVNTASTLAASSATGLISRNKSAAIVAGLALGLLAGSVVRPERD